MTAAADLAAALGGKRAGRQWVCRCPAHGDRDPSLIVFDGRAAVQVRCLAGCAPSDVIAALRARGLWQGRNGNEGPLQRRRVTAAERRSLALIAARRAVEERAAAAARTRLALAIWEDAGPALGTPVEEIYLGWWRGLEVGPERRGVLSEVLRFHPRCPRRDGHAPAMVALMRAIDGDAPTAIHRTFFDVRWRKDGVPMMLGPAGGAAIKLGNGSLQRLYLCEGVETALAVLARGCAPVWAAGSAGAIERFPVLADVAELVVCADHDAAGEKAAGFAVARWRLAGKAARGWMPDVAGTDFADAMRL